MAQAPLSVARATLRRVKDLLGKVLDFQPSWTATNTEVMQKRGVIIRQQLPDVLRAHGADLASALGAGLSELASPFRLG
jgi:hypothetical protein